jgi:hypothetical protein
VSGRFSCQVTLLQDGLKAGNEAAFITENHGILQIRNRMLELQRLELLSFLCNLGVDLFRAEISDFFGLHVAIPQAL